MATPRPEPRFARIAAMLADPARSRMLACLLSGEYASAGELAAEASVTPSTASGHLTKLRDAELVVCEVRGRHRYYRLADESVARALEALALVAERGEHDKAWAHPSRSPLRAARCCYGHIAGRLGISLMDSLREAGALAPAADGFSLTPAGERWLADLGLSPTPPSRRRRFAYACLDWSERRDHLAGQLADEICSHALASGWVRRGEGRALVVTPKGEREWLPRLVRQPD